MEILSNYAVSPFKISKSDNLPFHIEEAHRSSFLPSKSHHVPRIFMSSPSLLGLPRELRDMIYESLFDFQVFIPEIKDEERVPINVPERSSASIPQILSKPVGLLSVNHQISAEATPKFYSGCTFVGRAPDVARFLHGNGTRRELVRFLELKPNVNSETTCFLFIYPGLPWVLSNIPLLESIRIENAAWVMEMRTERNFDIHFGRLARMVVKIRNKLNKGVGNSDTGEKYDEIIKAWVWVKDGSGWTMTQRKEIP